MTDTAERQLRAYVVLEDGDMEHVSHPVQLPAAKLTVRNTGETPANDLIIHANIALADYPLTDELPPVTPAPYPGRSVLGRNSILTIPQTLGAPLTKGELAGMRFGQLAIYVYGHLTYVDVFGHKWTTHFRLMHRPAGGRIGSDTSFIVCDEGNQAE